MPDATPLHAPVDQAILSAVEQRIESRIGRWTLAIIGSAIMMTGALATMWYGLQSRVEKLETWKSERALPIDEYHKFREELEGRLSRLEAGQEAILEALRELKDKR